MKVFMIFSFKMIVALKIVASYKQFSYPCTLHIETFFQAIQIHAELKFFTVYIVYRNTYVVINEYNFNIHHTTYKCTVYIDVYVIKLYICQQTESLQRRPQNEQMITHKTSTKVQHHF